jgi:hypothetical protein
LVAACRAAWRAGAALALAALTLTALPAYAAELRFSASVDRTTVGVGEQFQLVLTVQGEDMLSAPAPTLPQLPDFTVLGSSSSQSTNISIIGGQMKKEATVSFIYALTANKLGTFWIPACKFTYQGREYASQPITMTVVKEAQGRAAPGPGAGGGGAPAVAPSRTPAAIEGNLFLSVIPSRRTVYVGEPLTVEVSLCTRYQIANGGWAEVPSFNGFWTEKLFEADRFDFQNRVIEGRSFGVSVLEKVALIPISPGQATLKPLAFNAAVSQPPRDVFDLFGSTQNVRVTSKPITIDVLPLPEQGKPAEFTGGVGQFTLAATLDRMTSNGSEPVNLTVKLSGNGNLRMIDKPTLPAIQGLKILDPEIKDDAHVSGESVRGTKTFRYPIIPQSDGKYLIAPIVIAYFDPQAKSYKTLRTTPLEFAASGTMTSAPVVEATGLKVLGTDIGYIKPDATTLAVTPMTLPWWPNLLYLLSFGMMGSAVWYRGHSERLLADRGYARKSRSSALVRRRLKDAEALLRKKDEKGFYAELTRAVMGYVGDRFNIDSHAMTREQLRAELDRLAVAPETSGALLAIVDQCEIARFSPGLAGVGDARTLFTKTRDLLGRL